MNKVLRFFRNEGGPTAVEYAVLLALLVGMMMAAIGYVSTEIQAISDKNVEALDPRLTPND